MARTRASVAAKVAPVKSSKAESKAAPPPSSAAPSGSTVRTEKSTRSYSGGNPVCPRETPKWQKPITNFFITNNNTKHNEVDSDVIASTSKYKPKRNVIESDDEEEQTKVPKNTELEESFALEPLNGEECHKIDEYYADPRAKSKENESNKENIEGKTNKNKRSLEEEPLGEESVHAKKKVKSY